MQLASMEDKSQVGTTDKRGFECLWLRMCSRECNCASVREDPVCVRMGGPQVVKTGKVVRQWRHLVQHRAFSRWKALWYEKDLFIRTTLHLRITNNVDLARSTLAKLRQPTLLFAWNGWLSGAMLSSLHIRMQAEEARTQVAGLEARRKKRRRLVQDDQTRTILDRLEEYAKSDRLDLQIAVIVAISTIASGLQNACDSDLGAALSCTDGDQARWLTFHAALESIALICTATFLAEALVKLVGLGPKLYFSIALNWMDLAITVLSLIEVSDVMKAIRCMLSAQAASECEGGGSGLAVFRCLRLVSVVTLQL